MGRVDITLREGDIFGFLGPNSAGKTITIRTIFELDIDKRTHLGDFFRIDTACGLHMRGEETGAGFRQNGIE